MEAALDTIESVSFGPNCRTCPAKAECLAFEAASSVVKLIDNKDNPLVALVASDMNVFSTTTTPLIDRIDRMTEAMGSCPGGEEGVKKFLLPDSPPCVPGGMRSCEGLNAVVVGLAMGSGLRLVNYEEARASVAA